MKYMLLIHQGDTPTPHDPDAWARSLGCRAALPRAAAGRAPRLTGACCWVTLARYKAA
jgi:hypothetical protein